VNDDLNQAMAKLAAAYRAQRAPASVEINVLAEFDSARRRRHWLAASVAVTALAASAFLVVHKPAPHETPIGRPPAVVAAAHEIVEKPAPPKKHRRIRPAEAPETPFITIPYTVPLTPDEPVRVVRMALSPSALAAAGFPLSAVDLENGVPSDVLVDEDGRARAIRIVSNLY
jgi:hypothetical protein